MTEKKKKRGRSARARAMTDPPIKSKRKSSRHASPGQGYSAATILEPDSDREVIKQHILDAARALRVHKRLVTELRALGVPRDYGRPMTVSGYFDDPETLASAALELDERGAKGIYVTLNPVTRDLLGRACNQVIESPETTSGDKDIPRRLWLPIDLDPSRPSGISSTPDEIEKARLRAVKIETWLRQKWDTSPDLRGFSGNGFHLLYRIVMGNNARAARRIESLLAALSGLFSDNLVQVDRGIFNAGRIWKLYGTMARKGDDAPELGRVHRRSQLIQSFEEFVLPC